MLIIISTVSNVFVAELLARVKKQKKKLSKRGTAARGGKGMLDVLMYVFRCVALLCLIGVMLSITVALFVAIYRLCKD